MRSGWGYYIKTKYLYKVHVPTCTVYALYWHTCTCTIHVVPSQFLSISTFASSTIGGIYTVINLHMLTLDIHRYPLVSPPSYIHIHVHVHFVKCPGTCPSPLYISTTHPDISYSRYRFNSLYTPHTWFYDNFYNYDFMYSTSQISSPDSAHKQIHPPFQLEVE